MWLLAAPQCRLSTEDDDAGMNTHTNTTTTSTNDTTHTPRRYRRTGLLLAAGAVALLTFTGCSAAQRRALGEQDIHDSLVSHVARVVNDHSLSMSRSFDCTSRIDSDSHVSASCVGYVRSGQIVKPVTATFVGTADVDAETCTAVLAVAIDGVEVIDQPYVSCFDSI